MQERIERFLKPKVHPSWLELLRKALGQLDRDYLEFILESKEYLPKGGRLFAAFKTLPRQSVQYILFGQDPYPREQSAIGVAFIDGAVETIFSKNGLSKAVNRATSLRNFIKMLLVADGRLQAGNTTPQAIATIKKDDLIEHIEQLKENFEKNGVLLLNTALIFTDKKSSAYHIKQWQPFVKYLLEHIEGSVELILFGNYAKEILKKFHPGQNAIVMPHPYNVSFINLDCAHRLFGEMGLLSKGLNNGRVKNGTLDDFSVRINGS